MEQAKFKVIFDNYQSSLVKVEADEEELGRYRISSPKVPISVSTIAELFIYQKQFVEYQKTNKILEEQLKKTKILNKETQKTLMEAIAVPNIWVKVGDKAVGIYENIWNENHWCLVIKDWSENLPELNLYYS